MARQVQFQVLCALRTLKQQAYRC